MLCEARWYLSCGRISTTCQTYPLPKTQKYTNVFLLLQNWWVIPVLQRHSMCLEYITIILPALNYWSNRLRTVFAGIIILLSFHMFIGGLGALYAGIVFLGPTNHGLVSATSHTKYCTTFFKKKYSYFDFKFAEVCSCGAICKSGLWCRIVSKP